MQPYVLTVSPECKVVAHTADRDGRPMLRHDCASAHGVSGAPLLVKDGAGWSIVGVHVAQRRDDATIGIATVLDQARKRL
jgi:hypothetical protein